MATAATMVSSAGALISMLGEDHPSLKLYALKLLNSFAHILWPEISACIPQLETIYEDGESAHKPLSALLVSKIFYHLNEAEDSLKFALGAGSLFDVSEDSDYVRTLLDKAIDEYASLWNKAAEGNADKIDPRLEAIVERMLDKCILDGRHHQAIGMAIECRRLDKLEEAITKSDNIHRALSYCIHVSHSYVNKREYRQEILQLLVKIYRQLDSPDYLSICQCLMFLYQPEVVAIILEKLLTSENTDYVLLAFQIAFDLVENEHQAFLLAVRDQLPDPKSKSPGQAQSVREDLVPATNQPTDVSEDVQMTDAPVLPMRVCNLWILQKRFMLRDWLESSRYCPGKLLFNSPCSSYTVTTGRISLS